MAVSKDLLNRIKREAGSDLVHVVQAEEAASKAKMEAATAADRYESTISELEEDYRAAISVGYEQQATAGAMGFAIGGAIAYFFHDNVSDYFGKNTWPALLALPGLGVALAAGTKKLFPDGRGKPGEKAAMRAGAYGTGIGLVVVGGYLSYQDYSAAT